MWVGNHPGAIAFTWILVRAHFTARSWVKEITPPLLAWYAMACTVSGGAPLMPATEAILMILPLSCLSMILPAACAHRKVPVRLVSITLFHSANVIFSVGTPQEMPALLIRMSIFLNSATVAATNCSTLAWSFTSQAIAR